MLDRDLLDAAADCAARFLTGVGNRQVRATTTSTELVEALGGPLPSEGRDAREVITHLAAAADGGIVASAGPRYFGFVTGGAVPVTVAADWLAAAWDQNGALYVMSPAVAVLEDIVAGWLLEFLGLPDTSSVGYVTGCHMANVTCLAAARHEVLRRAGWDVERQGLQRAPRVHVVVGEEVHVSAVAALRLLGFGTDELIRVPVDGAGRMRADALDQTLTALCGPVIVCTQAGNVNTGASDPFAEIIPNAHARGAWVHVDGAFGLWAAAVPLLAKQVGGFAAADSWATDAHKWLNVPYDSGLAIVAHPEPHRAAMSMQASYLQRDGEEERNGMDWVPESSRRARVVPLYALLRTLGADGIRELIARTCRLAQRMAAHLTAERGVRVLNDVLLNQVLVEFGEQRAAETTKAVIAAVQAEGSCWAGGAEWQGHSVMRLSVSSWSTTDADIDLSADAILRAYRRVAFGR